MSPNQESSAAQTALCDEDKSLLQIVEIQLLHEATLHNLICTRNYSVDQLLSERNQLLQEEWYIFTLFLGSHLLMCLWYLIEFPLEALQLSTLRLIS